MTMDIKKNIFAALAVVAMAASCDKMDSGSYYGIQIGKPVTADMPFGYAYANETEDSLCFLSYSPWRIELVEGDNSFVTIKGDLTGKAYTITKYGVEFEENKTGKSRYATFRIVDSEDASRARASFRFRQFATRQDGSLGNAAEVRTITGSDGSNISIDYDGKHRPTAISMSAGEMKREIEFSYDERERTVTAKQTKYEFTYADTLFTLNNLTLEGECIDRFLPGSNMYIFQPRMITGLESAGGYLVNNVDGRRTNVSQKIGYKGFSNGVYDYSFANGFMINNTIGDKFVQAYGFYYNGKGSLEVDSLHRADSIGIERIYSDHSHKAEMYKMTYSNIDNRTTTVDVNQLMEGVANCDPFMLLSFYKLARQTSIMARAEGKKGTTYVFETATNADGSIKTVAVSDNRGKTTTYTFGY